MKSIKYLSSLLILLATLTGCSGYQLVNSRTYDDGWLSKYSTFRIINTDEGKIPPGVDMTVYYNIANSIRQEMAYRGFHEDPPLPFLSTSASRCRRISIRSRYYLQTISQVPVLTRVLYRAIIHFLCIPDSTTGLIIVIHWS